MKKRYQIVHAILLCCLMFSLVLHAGITGKISGDIIDVETQQALVGANVILEGTMMGAASSGDGYFNILNVPPGTYTVKATMMGYKPMLMQNVRVNIDQTTKVNFALPSTVVESDESVTIVADRPLVKADMTSSLASVSAEEIEALPVNSMSEVLAIQAGVVRDGNDFHIRGGRSGEIAFWVDGVATTDVYNGGMGVTVENTAIQELQVVSGTFNAEYGQAMSGIVNIITKEGSGRYTGDFSAYVGDYISNAKEWDVMTDVRVIQDPETGALSSVADTKNPLKAFNPIYNSEFNLSGPIPLLGKNVTFFANSRYQSTEGHLYGSRWFTPQGFAGDSSIVPLNPYWKISGQGKLTWRINSNFKVSYNLFYNEWQNDRTYSQANRYNPDGQPLQKGNGLTHIFALNHVLSQSTFYEARVTRLYNEYSNYVYEDPSQGVDYLVRVEGDTARALDGFTFDPKAADAQTYWDNVQNYALNYKYIVKPGSIGYVHSDSSAAPINYSYNDGGMNMTQFKRSTAYWIGKVDLTSQIARAHQLKTGFEARLHELTLNQFTIQEAVGADGKPVDPFQPMVPSAEGVNHDVYNQKPMEFSAYLQDKIELQEININIGVRFDYFDPNTKVPVNPHDPNIYMPANDYNIYKGWVDPPADASQEERNAYYASYVGKEYTPEERKGFMLKDAEASYAVSPRLGIAYPITDRGVIHFSYGHFFQIPNFQNIYSNPYFKLSESGGYVIFGNPALRPERTVQYEIGLQQQISDNIGIDVTLFYKDIRDWVGTSPLIETDYGPAVKYSQYENKEYSNIRGITIKLDKRYSNNFSAGVDYSFQIAEGTYSNPNDAFNAINSQQEPLKAIIPLNWDQNHTLNGRVVTRLGEWTASLIGRYWSGRPYTPTFYVGEVTGGSARVGLKQNSSRLPAQKNVDLYINRRFPFSGIYLDLFINVFNLFDTRDEVTVYTDSGTAEYTTQIRPNETAYAPTRVGTVGSFVSQPSWFSTPRQVQVGISVGF